MTPRQKDIYMVIDEWWKRFGFGPSIDDIMRQTGDKGRGNVATGEGLARDVDVAIDESGGHDETIATDSLLRGVARLDIAGLADGDDVAPTDGHRTVADDVPGGVHRDDVPALDDGVDVLLHFLLPYRGLLAT